MNIWYWQARARRLHVIFASLCAGLVVAVSWAPFRWTPVDPANALDQFIALWSATQTHFSRSDFAINLLLTIPLAYALLGAMRLGYIGRAPTGLLALVTVGLTAAITIFVEFSQLFFAARVPSLYDIQAQLVGAVLGVALWRLWGLQVARLFIADDIDEPASSGWLRLLTLYTIAFALYSLMPLDVIFHPGELYQKWKAGAVAIVPFQLRELSPVAWLGALVVDFALWVPVGLRIAASASSRRSALTAVVLFPILLEFAQLFIASRVSDSTDIILGIAGGAFGYALAARVGALFIPVSNTASPVPKTLSSRWHLATLVYSLLIVFVYTFPYDFNLSPAFIKANLASLARAPFAAGLVGSPVTMLFDGIRTLAVYSILGGLVAVAWRTSRLASVTGLVAVLAALWAAAVSGTVEFAKLALPARANDVTDMMIASLCAFAGCLFVSQMTARIDPLRRPERTAKSSDTRTDTQIGVDRTAATVTAPDRLHEGSTADDHIRALDGLRALAACGVFAVHWQQLTQKQFAPIGEFMPDRLIENGNTGVALFFVLSGFLLSVPLWQSLARTTTFSYVAFALRRLARIAPAYYGCLVAVVVILAIKGEPPAAGNLLSHMAFVHHWWDEYFYAINAPFWTIGVEVQFYVLLAIGFACMRVCKVRAPVALWFVLFTIAVAFVLQYMRLTISSPLGDCIAENQPSVSHSLLAHLPVFLIGTVTGYVWLNSASRATGSIKHDLLVVGAITSCAILLSTRLDDTIQFCGARYHFPIVPIALAVLVYNAPRSRVGCWLFDNAPLAWAGRISYGIYLFHLPIQKALKSIFNALSLSAHEQWLAFGALSAVITVVVAGVSYSLFERPIVNWVRARFALSSNANTARGTTSRAHVTDP